jgi:Tfp pilus assembly protein PilN
MKHYKINLLKRDDENLVNKVVYFCLHYLRYIIVITQIVVIVVFFYRFKIDQDIIDLKENVEQKQEIFKITLPLIEEAQAIDHKSNLIKSALKEQNDFSDQLNYVLSIIPEGMILKRLEFDNTTIRLTGIAADIRLIKMMTEKIKTEKKFKDITVNQVQKDLSVFDFIIVITR